MCPLSELFMLLKNANFIFSGLSIEVKFTGSEFVNELWVSRNMYKKYKKRTNKKRVKK